ncbi:MAG: NAD(P)H-dependent oxidoreductase [Candidatus Paceibacterota bacterium]|jgi:nitroreductase
MENIIKSLGWRYATKIFDTSKKLTDEQLGIVTEALRLSASSFGLQPWKFIVVTNPEVRKQLREAAYGQAQITDASHLIVFTTSDINEASVDAYVESMGSTRGMDEEAKRGMKARLFGSVQNRTPEALREWAARQCYIALGTLLTVAANEKIDACPMEGFENAKFDAILGLKEKGLSSVVLATVGFRSENDKHANEAKVRFPKEEVIIEIK